MQFLHSFDLILRLRGIFRLGVHPSVFSYMQRNTFSMDAKMYSKMPTKIFLALRIGNYSGIGRLVFLLYTHEKKKLGDTLINYKYFSRGEKGCFNLYI